MLSLSATLQTTLPRYDLYDPMRFDKVDSGTSEKSGRYLSDIWNRLSSVARLLHPPLLSAKPTPSHFTFKTLFQPPASIKEGNVPMNVSRRLKKSNRPAPAGHR